MEIKQKYRMTTKETSYSIRIVYVTCITRQSFKMSFTADEAVDMIGVYFECLQNAAIAQRVYAARYPNRRRRDTRIFSRLVQRLRTTGSFRPVRRRRRHTGRTEENVVNVLAYIEFNPHISTRALSLALGISRTTIQNILKDHR